MPDSHPSDLPRLEEVEQQVRRWLALAAEAPRDRGADQLARLLTDPRGLEFTAGFVDRVIRPDDARVAANHFERLSRRIPLVLPWYLRSAVVAGGGFGIVAPQPIIPAARAVFRRLVQHLVVDATPARLTKTLGALRKPGVQLDLALLGPAVLGERGADRRLSDLAGLLARTDVDAVSLAIPAIAPQLPEWAFEDAVARAVERLTPLYEQAARSRTRKFITLEVHGHRDLELTLAVFTRLLAQPDLRDLEAGIVLPACFPESLPALERVSAWATERVAAGGASIKVRIVKGASVGLEQAEAAVHGWPLATWATKAETDAQYVRMLTAALDPGRVEAVRVGVAGHNLFHLAFAHLLAEHRGVSDRVEFEMLLGVAPSLAEALRADLGAVRLGVPAVEPAEFGAAIPYLVGRLEENASAENFLAALPHLDEPEVFAREAGRFAAALDLLPHPVPATYRVQDRSHPDVPRAPEVFANTPDTDPAVAGNRGWVQGVLSRATTSTLGVDTATASRLTTEDAVAGRVRDAAAAGREWGALPGSARAEHLDRVGEVLEAFRGRLVEVMVSETGTTFPEADAEVGQAVDLARHTAARARELAGIPGAMFEPVALTVVASSRTTTVADPARGVLAALAAGSAVLLKPAPSAVRAAAVLTEALWEAGIPRHVFGVVDVPEDVVGRSLITAPEVGRVRLTGSVEIARRFLSWRPDLPLLADVRGANSMIVTPSADLDRAVADLVVSAFGDAGQKHAAASRAILVDSIGTSERFRAQLADAVAGLAVGSALDPATRVGPLAEPAEGEVLRALTHLGDGESWLVKPRQLDETGRLWSPGVRDGVRPGNELDRAAAPAPVLDLVTVSTLSAAIALQNASDDGLSAGIHSLDAGEVDTWLDAAQAGSLHVNRPITDAPVRRHPYGGWRRSAAGPGAKTGGPNTLLVFGDWRPEDAEASEDLTLDGLDDRVRTLIEAFQPALDFLAFDTVRRAAFSDQEAWATEFGRGHDPSSLGVERHVLRYRPAEVVVRADADASLGDLARVLAAGVRARAKLLISTATPVPSGLLPFVDDGTPLSTSPLGILGVTVESDAAFRVRAATGLPARIRLVGTDAASLRTALDGSLDTTVWAGAVTAAGRLELLPFLREQSVSITAHRFGMPDRDLQALTLGG